MEFVQIEVKEREERGTRSMRRLRAEGWIPGVLYGLGRRNLPLSIPAPELQRFLRSGSHLVELKMGSETRDAIIREVQADALTEEVLHVDLVRVDKDAAVEDQVPVTWKGTAPGTREGGLFQGLMDHVAVSARPRDIPREIVVDITHLHVGGTVHLRDLAEHPGVTYLGEPDDLVAHVVPMRGLSVDEAEEGMEEGPSEPELIGREEGAPAEGA